MYLDLGYPFSAFFRPSLSRYTINHARRRCIPSRDDEDRINRPTAALQYIHPPSIAIEPMQICIRRQFVCPSLCYFNSLECTDIHHQRRHHPANSSRRDGYHMLQKPISPRLPHGVICENVRRPSSLDCAASNEVTIHKSLHTPR